ncbi:MAG: DUF4249 family protein [Bacteroidota bacterium]
MVYSWRFIVLLALLCSIGCEEPVELDLPVPNSKIAISSEFGPNRPFEVSLSNSVSSISSANIQFLANANVTIWEGDKLFEALRLVRDPLTNIPYYRSRNRTSTSHRAYRIVVEVPGYPTASAEDLIPEATPIQRFTLDRIERQSSDAENQNYDVEFSLDFRPDPASDFYHLIVYYEAKYIFSNPPGTNLINNDRNVIAVVDVSNNPRSLTHFSKGMLIRSSDIPGAVAQFRLQGVARQHRAQAPMNRRLVAELRTVSPDYYHFHSSFTRQLSQTDSILGQPVVLHNNIENGLGSFAAYNYVEAILELD